MLDSIKHTIVNKIKAIHRFFKFGYSAYKKDYMQWDSGGALEMFKESLQYLEPGIRNGYGANKLKKCKQIKVICALIDRVNNKHEYPRGIEWLERTYGQLDYEFVESERKGFYRMIDKNPKRQGKIWDAVYRRMLKNDMNAEELEFQLLMKLLTKHLRGFWD